MIDAAGERAGGGRARDRDARGHVLFPSICAVPLQGEARGDGVGVLHHRISSRGRALPPTVAEPVARNIARRQKLHGPVSGVSHEEVDESVRGGGRAVQGGCNGGHGRVLAPRRSVLDPIAHRRQDPHQIS